MIVANSSFLVEGLLKDKGHFDDDVIVTVVVAVYEVANSIWKHQYLIKDIRDGLRYLSIFHELLKTNKVQTVHPYQDLIELSYEIAAKNKLSIYDAIFVSLALEMGTGLKTYDVQQAAVMERESTR
jgi:predicted nucleic acid-binding protein